MRLVLLGAPGAGKGTQGALIAERRGFPRIVTGELLRAAVREGTELGRQAARYMDAGELVPDDVILGLIREVLTGESDADEGFVLDGFPRTLAQAKALHPLLRGLDHELDAVAVIDVPEDVLIKRLTGRRTCSRCGKIYNIYFDPPAVLDECDVCGGELTQRKDDDPATVRRRLEVYREQTEPLIEYYRTTGTPVVTVDGNRSIASVEDSIERALAS